MNRNLQRWIKGAVSTAAVLALTLPSLIPARAETDFNLVGKEISMLLQNFHFSKPRFNKEFSSKFLETYLGLVDPSRIYFTQADVDRLHRDVALKLPDSLFDGKMLQAAGSLHSLYVTRATERTQYALMLLDTHDFNFNTDQYVPLSRKKELWPANEAEMRQVWRNRIKSQLLDEILWQEGLARQAARQGKPDPVAGEKPPKEKLVARYDRALKSLGNSSENEEKANLLLSALARSLDPHSDYLGAMSSNRFKEEMGAASVGIGVFLAEDERGGVRITGFMVGGPAEQSGQIELNDRIVAVDPDNSGTMVSVTDLDIEKIVEMVRGPEGSEARYQLVSASDSSVQKTVLLTRRMVENKETLARGEIIDIRSGGDGATRIGILSLPSFYGDLDGGDRSSAKDVKTIVERMVREGVKGIVIDLRGNGGGLFEEATLMAGLFIGRGPVVQVKDARGQIDRKTVSYRKPAFDGEIVVLIDRESASASEILAATLQDYGRAVIVGDPSSYGKGTVQELVPVARYLPYFIDHSGVGMLKVTTQKFYRIEGGSTQLRGVESDIVLPTYAQAYEEGEAAMDFAMPYDKIAPVKGYRKDKWLETVLPELREKSMLRVAADVDFQVAREDVELYRRKTEENRLSLNKYQREREEAEMETRRRAIYDERKTRFEKMALEDARRFSLFRLTLDDIGNPELVPADPERDQQQFTRLAPGEFGDLEDGDLAYPSGLDPELRESISIVSDMIELKQKARRATVVAIKPEK